MLAATTTSPPARKTAMTPDAPSPDRQRQKISEFLQLLPLTLAIAGLPDAEHGKYFNEGHL
jgi:hypothetical protein